MNDGLWVKIFNSFSNLSDHQGSRFLWEGAFALEDVKELSIGSQFKEEIDMILVTEEIIDFNQVGMVQERLNFNFIY